MSDVQMLACRKAIADTLIDISETDRDVVVISSDARGSAALKEFVAKRSQQYVECGIAEQNEISVAAGMARCGKKPFVCAPAAFVSGRGYEQIKVDVAYSRTNVKLIGVSGGVSYGPLGCSHYAIQDIAALRAIYGIQVFVPADATQASWIIKQIKDDKKAAYIRIGRNPVPVIYEDESALEWGKAVQFGDGKDVAIIACGQMVYYAIQAAELLEKEGIQARVLDMYRIKPIDKDSILRAAKETGRILTVEEHTVKGGLGSAVAEIVSQECPIPMKIMGIPDNTFEYGSQLYMFERIGLTPENIANNAKELMSRNG